ncbi:MAG: UDP-N-acetylmuramate:L-alanyl-gamma-D-glutamyl-meso-diaminopimelate ligase [Burkholderiaceae bacterium]|jgi:UDP-N-acetylmuramate: L-alanyl-gamma-D-glutamyl-meso-diaminopimelate ligase
MHIHVLGICGTFMGGLAVLARTAGHRVTGCDLKVYPPMSTQLAEQGIDLTEGYGVEQLALKPDLWVIGNVVSRGNPLMEAILNQGLAYTSGPQWVSEHLLSGRWVLAVAGTHGKTTTSSILTWILEHAGYEPSFLIGGVPQNFGVSARLTESPFFVIEADEYDTAFFDKRSKFVHYRPRTAILNNLEYDHADIFPDLDAIETQFHHLVRTIPSDGQIVAHAPDPALARVLARGVWTPVETFGDSKGWHCRGTEEHPIVWAGESEIGALQWTLQGEHNQANALAALAAARHAGVLATHALEALEGFSGVRRRMELRGSVAGVAVYDDFAHHPTALAATVAGLRAALSRHAQPERILAVVEPRSNTMKLGVMKAALPTSLAQADLVFGYGAKEGKDALGWDLAAALAPLGAKARAFDDLDQLCAAVVDSAQPGDHVLIMSNGGFGNIHQSILDALGERVRRDP